MHILVALACDAERLATTAVQRAQPASTGVESMPGAGGMACIFKVGAEAAAAHAPARNCLQLESEA